MDAYKIINSNYTITNGIAPRDGKYITCPRGFKLEYGDGIIVKKINTGKIDEVLQSLSDNDAVILYGPGGTGKTYAINQLARYWSVCGIKYQITATTGVATTNFDNAKTIHSWSGIGIRNSINDPKKELSWRARKNIYTANILVIDEISMMCRQLFETLEEVCRKVRNSTAFFGGIKLVMSGDFKQLPPPRGEHCWRSVKWATNVWKIKIIKFTEPKRFDNVDYHEFLKRVRTHKCTATDLETLKTRIVEPPKHVDPLIIMGYKSTVRHHNHRRLAELNTAEHTFTAVDVYTKSTNKHAMYKRFNSIIPESIKLKPGARVMLRINLDTEAKLCNGTCGTVVTCDPLVVNFAGNTIAIEPHAFKYDDCIRHQIPLILAWAITIHKSQGCTLDDIQCDLAGEIFTYEQIYVVLSRVRKFESLYIKKINDQLFR